MWVLGTIHKQYWKLNILLITQPAYKLNITIINLFLLLTFRNTIIQYYTNNTQQVTLHY